MSDQRGTLEALGQELSLLLAPLAGLTPATAPGFLVDLGLVLDAAQANSIAPALASMSSAISKLIQLDFELEGSIDAGDGGLVVTSRIALLDQIADVIAGFNQLQTALAGLNLPNAAPIVANLPKRVFDLLLARYLGHSRGVFPLLELTGILERTDQNVGVFDPATPFFTTYTFHLDRVGGWLDNPAAQLAALYDWNQPTFDGKKILAVIDRLVAEAGFPSMFDASAAAPVLDLLLLDLSTRTDLSPRALELRIKQPIAKGVTELGARRWTAAVGVDTNVLADTALVIGPGGIVVHPPDATTPAGAVRVEYERDIPSDRPVVLLSLAGAGRITVGEVGAKAELRFDPNGTARLTLGAELGKGRIEISTADADGFIASILGAFRLESSFDLGVGYSIDEGLFFRGSSALEVQIASHIAVGPHSIDGLTLVIGIDGNRFPVGVRADLRATFGPLTAVVQGIGFEAAFALESDNSGNLGPLDIVPRFLPPYGAGLSVDAGGFKGGGFLLFDQPKGEYGGGLELDFQGIVTVKAVGLLTTKFPDGSAGFSLVIIISAEFPPIQLGFGFTLLGVGGLLGLDRTVNEDALGEGVHQGSLDSVLFPRDIVRNAPRIINDLRRLFPPASDHFLVGPMVKFGWGTPTIVSLEFGFILDIPRPAFFVIGRLRIGLPFQDAPLFDIRVAFAGGVDFELGQLWFDGTLHDSRLLTFALTGDMAIRLYWKHDPNFVLTIGGFHPAYTPPPMQLGNLQRLGITIFAGNPRLRAETYLAITSNTVQFGAKAELYFGIDVFNVYGFIALDVLIQFEPFKFIATLSAMLSVRSGVTVLMGIRVQALLEGPTPWHGKGTGHFEISFIISVSLDVDFEVTLGDPRHDTLPPVAVLPKLVEAFAHPDNWRAVLPPGTHQQVTLRAFDPPASALVLHPAGMLQITQKAVPLNLPIQKVGTVRVSDGATFRVGAVTIGTTVGTGTPLREQFAPAQYIDMPDTQKLSSRSFEKYEAGVQLGGGSAVKADYVKSLSIEYEVIYIPRRRKRLLSRLAAFLFDAFARTGAVARSPLSAAQSAPSPLGPPAVRMDVEQFAVASSVDLTVPDQALVFPSEAEARAAMQAAVERDPSIARTVQVVPLSLTRAA